MRAFIPHQTKIFNSIYFTQLCRVNESSDDKLLVENMNLCKYFFVSSSEMPGGICKPLKPTGRRVK